MAKSSKMTSKAASRIQSATAKNNGGKVSKGSFASRAQKSASKGKNRGVRKSIEKVQEISSCTFF